MFYQYIPQKTIFYTKDKAHFSINKMTTINMEIPN